MFYKIIREYFDMRVIGNICRWILGIVFIFSGFVKGIDPLGSTYKFTDYFNAFHISFLNNANLSLAVLLALVEVAIGIGLFTGAYIVLFALLALIFMVFFTCLTFYLALENPVSDCGCFGDALILTNWETFYKNIVFLILALVVFVYRKRFFGVVSRGFFRKLAFYMLIFVYLGLVYFSYNHLPVIDFRPYKIGSNIREGMKIPKDAPKDVYKNVFYYENIKSGEVKKFDDTNYPWRDTLNWKFVKMDDPILVEKGYAPPIKDFFMQTADGDDVADFFLNDKGYSLIFIGYRLDQASPKNLDRLKTLKNWALKNGVNFVGLTASLNSEVEDFNEMNDLDLEFLFGDEINLKTIIRSNPGLMLLKDGVVVDKWHFNDYPSEGNMDEYIKN